MKKLFKLFLTLMLVLSLLVGGTSCDILLDYGVNGGNNDIDGAGNNTPADTHKHVYYPDVVAPTCTETGYTTYACECGRSYLAEKTSALGHSYDDGVCTLCGDALAGGDVNETPEENPEEKPEEKPEDKPVVTPDPEMFDGGILYLPNKEDPVTSDPYTNVNVTEFYANYTPAISYMDAYYRTQHNLMSGSIGEQSATPYISAYQPVLDGLLIRNTTYLFSEDGNTYYVVNAYGEIVNEIYKCGSYIMLEEVAAYVFAFGTYPANHSANKKEKPSSSPWGKYLRVNHTNFTGDTSKYPYEPELPNITGCGGDLYYYEMDIGTAGYNNGSSISRGACRIVYTRKDLDGDGVIEIDETYLFYTQNHYHDFREYLNYEGGWGTVFGDEAGGGISRPTPYVETAYSSFVYSDGTPAFKVTAVVLVWIPEREEV